MLPRLLRARRAGMRWRKPQSQASRERRKAKPSAARAPLALEPSQSQSSGQRKKKPSAVLGCCSERTRSPSSRMECLREDVMGTAWEGAGQSRGQAGPGVGSGLLLQLGSWRLVADGVYPAPSRKMPAATWVINWKKEGEILTSASESGFQVHSGGRRETERSVRGRPKQRQS